MKRLQWEEKHLGELLSLYELILSLNAAKLKSLVVKWPPSPKSPPKNDLYSQQNTEHEAQKVPTTKQTGSIKNKMTVYHLFIHQKTIGHYDCNLLD